MVGSGWLERIGSIDWTGSVEVGRDQAREAAVRELTDPRYAADDPTPVQRVLQWVGRRITDLLDRAGALVPGGWLGVVLVAAAAIGIGVALWFGARSVLRERRLRTRSAAMFDEDRPRSAAEHRAAAEAAERSGDHVDALREWFRASVRGLEERGLLDARPGRTADEAAREITERFAPGAPDANEVAQRFDAVTFGGAPAQQQDAAAARRLDERVRAARPVAREGAARA